MKLEVMLAYELGEHTFQLWTHDDKFYKFRVAQLKNGCFERSWTFQTAAQAREFLADNNITEGELV